MMRSAIHRLLVVAAVLAASIFAGAARAEQIILYDGRNFGGTSVTLNQSTPNLGNFDNEASSVRVVSGTWILYRNANYGVTATRPSLTLSPGDYPDLGDAGFPRNRLSSVRLVTDDAAPQPVDCTPPYQVLGASGQCVWTCAQGTRPGPGGQCVCQSGLVETEQDSQGRRICRPAQLAPPPTTQPDAQLPVAPKVPAIEWIRFGGFDLDNRAYQTFDREVTLSTRGLTTSVRLRQARLEYRAAEGPMVTNDNAKLQILANAPWRPYRNRLATRPRSITFMLSAQPGNKYVYFQLRARYLFATGNVGGARWVNSVPHADTILLTPQGDASGMATHNVPAVQAYNEARARGFTFRTSGAGNICEFRIASGAMILAAKEKKGFRPPGLMIVPGSCTFTLFGSRPLAQGWSIVVPRPQPERCARGNVIVGPGGSDGVQVLISRIDFNYKPNPVTTCLIRNWRVPTVRIRGPVGFNWQAAFQ